MASAKLAEGEELGSNLLHIAQRIPANSGGLAAGGFLARAGQGSPRAPSTLAGACTIGFWISASQPAIQFGSSQVRRGGR